MRALVIDDSKPVRSILAKMLRARNFDTAEAANGHEALQLLEQLGKPDLVTVNWHMPEMDGLQFVRTVRSDARFLDLPLLMISGESEPSQVATAMAAGANQYIVKPCTEQALTNKLAKLGLSTSQASTSDAAQTAAKDLSARGKIRVLVVDDAVVVRRVVSSTLDDDPDLEVAGTAADGRMALERVESLKPDVVLLDVEMPTMDGLETLQALRRTHPRLPVIMFSSLTERGAAVTTDALLLGADDYVAKPGGTHMSDAEAGRRAIQEELLPKIKQLSLRTTEIGGTAPQMEQIDVPARHAKAPQRVDVVAMALSTGGPCALAKVLPIIAVDCPVPILIVQHMPPLFTGHLAERLAAGGKLNVREGVQGELLRPAMVRIAPGGFHMTVAAPADRPQLRLNQDPHVNSCRPSADVLFRSVAEVYSATALAVVMTGMGTDGLLGCKCIRQVGGQVLAQDESTSVVWGMPGQVVRARLADQVLSLSEMGHEVARLVRIQR